MSSLPKLKKFCRTDVEIIQAVNPVTSVFVYNNGVMIVKRTSKLQCGFDNCEGRKERKIKMLTQKSLAKLTATIQATDINLNTMLTLTYPGVFPRNGQEVKKALNVVLSMLRSKGKFSYVWFLEFQKRGAPHFHILTDHGGISTHMRVGVAETWVRHMINSDWFMAAIVVESVDYGECEYEIMIKHVKNAMAVALHRDTWQVVRDKDGAKKYVTKYASKPEQKQVPKNYRDVGRFWGCSRDVILSGGHEVKTTEDELQNFLKSQNHPASEFDMIPKYLWNVKGT